MAEACKITVYQNKINSAATELCLVTPDLLTDHQQLSREREFISRHTTIEKEELAANDLRQKAQVRFVKRKKT